MWKIRNILQFGNFLKNCCPILVDLACRGKIYIFRNWKRYNWGQNWRTDWHQCTYIGGLYTGLLTTHACCMHACMLSHVWHFATPWTVAHQASPSMEFPRQKYWSEMPFPTPIYACYRILKHLDALKEENLLVIHFKKWKIKTGWGELRWLMWETMPQN